MLHRNTQFPFLSAIALVSQLIAVESPPSLPTLYIDAQQTANTQPVATYESPVSNLEFEPRVDLQSRNLAEAQGDVTIRGGIFENTGFRVGSATLIDPQTGHYFAELPIAPEMLTAPTVLTGAQNALYGFNSTVGTIAYDWSRVTAGGSATLGGGDHDLNFQRLHQALMGSLGQSGEWTWGAEAEVSRSESDGTIRFGDHDFDRTTGRLQLLGTNSQTDFFAGYQSKFFGWPGMYTANPENLETENLKTRLFIINHRQNYGDKNEIELTAYHRRHSDHYVLTRDNPSRFEAFHETEASSLALSGKHFLSQSVAINYSAQFTADEIDSEDFFNGTALGGLERGDFQSRSHQKIAILPEYSMPIDDTNTLKIRVGAAFDDTNRDSSEFSPVIDLTWTRRHAKGGSTSAYLAYAETSQVAGYTAIGGGTTSGLFRSNPDLSREISRNVEIGTRIQRAQWSLETAAFYRWDDNLVDWTFTNGSPFARSANNLDIETIGFELIGTRRWGDLEAIIGYTYLHKDEDFGDALIDASFYALNYANHRITLGTIWRPHPIVEVRLDNEWRQNEENALREGSDSARFTHLGMSLYPPQIDGLELFLAIDNAWDDDFQDVPGTPGRGDQYSAGATYRW